MKQIPLTFLQLKTIKPWSCYVLIPTLGIVYSSIILSFSLSLLSILPVLSSLILFVTVPHRLWYIYKIVLFHCLASVLILSYHIYMQYCCTRINSTYTTILVNDFCNKLLWLFKSIVILSRNVNKSSFILSDCCNICAITLRQLQLFFHSVNIVNYVIDCIISISECCRLLIIDYVIDMNFFVSVILIFTV